MRTPNNDTGSVKTTPDTSPAARESDGAQSDNRLSSNGLSGNELSDKGTADAVRRCILSGDRAPRGHLVRLALSPDGDVLPDVRAKAPGRGAWIGVSRAELVEAQKKGRLKGALARAFKTSDFRVPDDLADRIAAALQRATLDRLGLEARAGLLTIGAERIETAARQGKVHMLLHASDARADGAAKLAQAWRVGSDREGSDLKGLALPVGRTILSLALGRENVVHAALTDARAARRVSEMLDRWLHFIGPERETVPCETPSRGASALGPDAPQTNEHTEELE